MYNGKCAKSMCVYVWREKTTLTEQCEKTVSKYAGGKTSIRRRVKKVRWRR